MVALGTANDHVAGQSVMLSVRCAPGGFEDSVDCPRSTRRRAAAQCGYTDCREDKGPSHRTSFRRHHSTMTHQSRPSVPMSSAFGGTIPTLGLVPVPLGPVRLCWCAERAGREHRDAGPNRLVPSRPLGAIPGSDPLAQPSLRAHCGQDRPSWPTPRPAIQKRMRSSSPFPFGSSHRLVHQGRSRWPVRGKSCWRRSATRHQGLARTGGRVRLGMCWKSQTRTELPASQLSPGTPRRSCPTTGAGPRRRPPRRRHQRFALGPPACDSRALPRDAQAPASKMWSRSCRDLRRLPEVPFHRSLPPHSRPPKVHAGHTDTEGGMIPVFVPTEPAAIWI